MHLAAAQRVSKGEAVVLAVAAFSGAAAAAAAAAAVAPAQFYCAHRRNKCSSQKTTPSKLRQRSAKKQIETLRASPTYRQNSIFLLFTHFV